MEASPSGGTPAGRCNRNPAGKRPRNADLESGVETPSFPTMDSGIPTSPVEKTKSFKDACKGSNLSWEEVIGKANYDPPTLDCKNPGKNDWPELSIPPDLFQQACEPWRKTLIVKVLGLCPQKQSQASPSTTQDNPTEDSGNAAMEEEKKEETSRNPSVGPWRTVQRKKGPSPFKKGQLRADSHAHNKAIGTRFSALQREEDSQPTPSKGNTLATKEDFDRVNKAVKSLYINKPSLLLYAAGRKKEKPKSLKDITNVLQKKHSVSTSPAPSFNSGPPHNPLSPAPLYTGLPAGTSSSQPISPSFKFKAKAFNNSLDFSASTLSLTCNDPISFNSIPLHPLSPSPCSVLIPPDPPSPDPPHGLAFEDNCKSSVVDLEEPTVGTTEVGSDKNDKKSPCDDMQLEPIPLSTNDTGNNMQSTGESTQNDEDATMEGVNGLHC
ncbi:hypothetical protein CCACVL1_22450 [Corchorus capsularis]|uniref:Uncharacterized protein n=1 Tax=Corchorus capsularis TaxID=210143 RepID=A0A1R3GYS9_COCAP|nr:hypothetical protein CCACVL1_22450 [Corchorus capsularis]